MGIIPQPTETCQDPWNDDAGHYHSAAVRGRVVLAQKGERWRQFPVGVAELAAMLRTLYGAPDWYLSQGLFSGRRCLTNLLSIATLYADFDNLPQHPAAKLGAVMQAVNDAGLPPPSLVIDSGRGAYAKWLIVPLPRKALPLWSALERGIVGRLRPHGADPAVNDGARVLRVLNTTNSKNGAAVSLLWPESGADARRYSPDELREWVLPHSRQQLQQLTQQRGLRTSRQVRSVHGVRRQWSATSYYWAAYCDILALAKLRGWDFGGAPDGVRDMTLFCASAALAWCKMTPHLSQEIAAAAVRFCPHWTPRRVMTDMGSVIRRALAASRGERVEWRGRQIDPRYHLSTAYLIDQLQVQPAEMAGLTVIIDRREKDRREHGREITPRAAYLAAAAAKRQAVADLAAQGIPPAEIARRLSLPYGTVRRIAWEKAHQ